MVLSADIERFIMTGQNGMSSIKSKAEQIRAQETERKNLMLEIQELKKMADAKGKALESELNMLRDEVKKLRLLFKQRS